jgi:hypothetical protein
MTATSQNRTSASPENINLMSGTGTEAQIDPVTLARLDYGLFLALRRMGTSKERICSALCLSYAEYDYIDAME